MLVLRTSNFQGATIRPIVPRHKHSIVYCSPLNFPVAAYLKTENDKNSCYRSYQRFDIQTLACLLKQRIFDRRLSSNNCHLFIKISKECLGVSYFPLYPLQMTLHRYILYLYKQSYMSNVDF